MALFDKDSNLNVGEKKYNISELLKHLMHLPGDFLVNFLKEIGLTIPRKLRMGVLKNVLKESVLNTIEERKSLADEMGYRLTWFSRYTDTQLVNLLEWYKDLDLQMEYLNQFWAALLNYFIDKRVANEQLQQLFNHALSLKNAAKVSTKDFNKLLNEVLYDDEGEIDGVTPENFRPVLYKSSTLTELREIGRKYNAPVPLRLKKKELLDVVFNKLEERNELTEDLKIKLPKQNIILLERYAKDHKILASTDLKKEEIIEYILSNAKETREKYFVPQSSAAYDMEVEDVEETAPAIEAAPKEEPVVEEVKEVVQTYVPGPQIDYRPEIDRLSKSFESLVDTLVKKDFVININASPQVHMESQKSEEPKKMVIEEDLEIASLNNKDLVAALFSEPDNLTLKVEEDTDLPEAVKEVVLSKDKLEPKSEVKEDSVEPTLKKTKVKYPMSNLLLTFAAIFAFLSMLVWLGVAVIASPWYYHLDLIAQYVNFYDIESLRTMYLMGGPLILALINFIALVRLKSSNVKRLEAFIYGLLLLPAGLVIAGVFALLATFSRGKEKTTKEVAKKDLKASKPKKVKVAKPRYHMADWLLFFASFFAFVSAVLWIGILVIAIPAVNQLGMIAPYVPFYDIMTIKTEYVLGASGILAVLNLLFAVRFKTKDVSRFEVFILSILSLVSGFVITGVFGLLAVVSKGRRKPEVLPKDTSSEVAIAINNIATNLKYLKSDGKSTAKSFFMLIFVLVFIAFLALIALYLVWRLPATYGYQNIDILNFGEILKSIITKIFGSSHF